VRDRAARLVPVVIVVLSAYAWRVVSHIRSASSYEIEGPRHRRRGARTRLFYHSDDNRSIVR